MHLPILSLMLMVAMLLATSGTRAAEVVATGISVPFFDDAGKLTHR
jgi:hypothetical protein